MVRCRSEPDSRRERHPIHRGIGSTGIPAEPQERFVQHQARQRCGLGSRLHERRCRAPGLREEQVGPRLLREQVIVQVLSTDGARGCQQSHPPERVRPCPARALRLSDQTAGGVMPDDCGDQWGSHLKVFPRALDCSADRRIHIRVDDQVELGQVVIWSEERSADVTDDGEHVEVWPDAREPFGEHSPSRAFDLKSCTCTIRFLGLTASAHCWAARLAD